MDKGRVAAHGPIDGAEAAARARLRAAREDARPAISSRSSQRLRPPASSVTRPTTTSCACSCRARAAPASSSRSRPPSGAQVRHLRPSVPTLEDVFAQAVGDEAASTDADPRSGLSAVRGRAGAARPRLGGHRAAPASGRCSRKRAFLGLLLAVVAAVLRPRGADLRRGQPAAGGVSRADRRRRSGSSSSSRRSSSSSSPSTSAPGSSPTIGAPTRCRSICPSR